MSRPEFSAAFKNSSMKRAKLRGLKRNAAVVLGNVGTPDDADVRTRALDDPEPLVREHAAWALARLRDGSDAPGDDDPRVGLVDPHRHDRLHPERAPRGDDAGEQAHREHEGRVGDEQRDLA